ncbi:serine/threonine kinase [Theileria orientalis]|uniref:Serine/threonine kinase n=1 Tax=Theileria orientalis TaxID=68886 RepID=A0A976MEG0_THEOR|nr:serine/threonine kinase [Theileria orientalis]
MAGGSSLRGYSIGSTLGVGSFAKVKLGIHKSSGRKVAIKIIDKSRMSSMGVMGKLSREISAINGLYHPNIIHLYDLIDTPDTVFLIMEYVDGGELFDYVLQRNKLGEVDAIRIFRQIISAVNFCHKRMLCHRDLKPENILMDKYMNIKIGDFGLSNFMRDGECLKTPCGSPNYASPEVICGKPYAGPEVDIWSCGIILYVLLCGSLPFDDDEIPALFGKIKLGKFYIPGHVTNDARWLLMRMLDVDPRTRITMQELLMHPWLRGCDMIYVHHEWESQGRQSHTFSADIIELLEQTFTVDPYNPHNMVIEAPKQTVFTLNENMQRWKLGVSGIKSEFRCISKLCSYLYNRSYVWKFRPGFRMFIKHSENKFNFVMQLYKLRYKTYLLDVQLHSGPLLECFHEAQRILNDLNEIMQTLIG